MMDQTPQARNALRIRPCITPGRRRAKCRLPGKIVDEDEVIGAIATVYDPEIPVNIYELGLIYAVDIADDGKIKVEMTLTAPGCPSAQELPVMVREAIMALPGVTACEVDTVWDPPWDMSRMSDEARLAMNMF